MIIWVVRVGDDVYIRSAYGPGNGWFRRAQASGTGRVKVPGLEQDVAFVAPRRTRTPRSTRRTTPSTTVRARDRETVVGPDVVAVTAPARASGLSSKVSGRGGTIAG